MHFPLKIEQGEDCSRFIFNDKEIGKDQSPHYVKGLAFEPRRDSLETSVFRIAGLDRIGLWGLGQEVHQTRPKNPHLFGGAILAIEAIIQIGLQVRADETPLRHAAIVGWPTDKARRMLLAKQIAAEAKLIYNPTFLEAKNKIGLVPDENI